MREGEIGASMQELRNQPSTAEWVAAGRDQLHRYLRTRLDCDEDAKDIAQEACLKMLQVSNLEEIRHPQAYLYRIAHHVLYQHYSHGRHSVVHEYEVDSLVCSAPSPADEAAASLRRRRLNTVLAELTPKCQTAVLLRWRGGLRIKEIAETMGSFRRHGEEVPGQGQRTLLNGACVASRAPSWRRLSAIRGGETR